MVSCLVLAAAMTLGQTTGGSETAAPQAPVSPVPAGDRWFFMKLLQGTWEGSLLHGHPMQISARTDVSSTIGTDRRTNLPLGFNYIPYELDVQQNWLRIERTVVTSGTTEPTFGFRWDTILPG